MTKLALLTLMASLSAAPAFAGGVQCQINNTCECQSNGTCDKFGNPIHNPNHTENSGTTIQCGSGESAMRVIVSQNFASLPDKGQVPARFENVAMPLSNFVTVSINPIFHNRIVQLQTAYCAYNFQLDEVTESEYYVLRASADCEGVRSEIQCEVL